MSRNWFDDYSSESEQNDVIIQEEGTSQEHTDENPAEIEALEEFFLENVPSTNNEEIQGELSQEGNDENSPPPTREVTSPAKKRRKM
jgi:hypothetical protein